MISKMQMITAFCDGAAWMASANEMPQIPEVLPTVEIPHFVRNDGMGTGSGIRAACRYRL
ncbi:hypothetical protein D3870_11655 [Noviherbaspirillum cavernae]|uniref:Uncharacterized protein n=1 Tax=Noviherbaspirillum cavernae TaxID=2320862 RepID=A0A418X2A6_9BURK|nr:hypothetical protein D3870_11655 [Noviherbaspirillum cavernae]